MCDISIELRLDMDMKKIRYGIITSDVCRVSEDGTTSIRGKLRTTLDCVFVKHESGLKFSYFLGQCIFILITVQ